MYAYVELSGKQFKVQPGKEIKVPYSKGNAGDEIVMDKVLFFNDGENMVVGDPFVKDVSITANIVNHGRERKIIVFKFKRRKGYQKKQGHRQNFTLIKINNVNSVKSSK
ncbi:MAG: 50S ribosomal protein L21 [Candidatus Marinimicrobia bacterium]|nr:50S ribosomal protein L21 [Candidatus Neomarinimicrobiota bacterium]